MKTIMATLVLLAIFATVAQSHSLHPRVANPGIQPLQATHQRALKHGNMRFDYQLYINNASSTFKPVINTPTMEAVWGCGAENKNCSCSVPEADPSLILSPSLSMKGMGTPGTMTGVEFLCRFAVKFVDARIPGQEQVLPGCKCTLHVNMPYVGANKFKTDCPCLVGFSTPIPEHDNVVTMSDTVSRV